MPATDAEKFELLYDALRAYQTGFVDAAFRVAAFILLVLGWLITSGDARSFLHAHQEGRLTAIAALALAAGIYALTSWRVYRFSQRTGSSLAQLAFMPEEYYADRVLRTVTLVIFVTANVLLTAVACIFVSLLGR